jgi:hypothetical protein
MLMNNLMVKEEVIMIHLIILNNHFHFHQMINKHVNEMDIHLDVIYFY